MINVYNQIRVLLTLLGVLLTQTLNFLAQSLDFLVALLLVLILQRCDGSALLSPHVRQ
ncbi:MAG: hypothetical protein ACYDEY_00935 [Acidimicrobiales bacterium]